MNTINPIPEGFRTLTPHMIIKHATAAMDSPMGVSAQRW